MAVIDDPILGLRRAAPAALAASLADARARTLALFADYRAALPAGLPVRYHETLNPPRWELGHVAWFEERWIGRHPGRLQGPAAQPEAALAPSVLSGADALYDSSRVAHARRWHLDLPDADRTLAYAARVRERTLRLLADNPADDDAMYFFRWALAHEDMHAEAAVYMAQQLALPLPTALERYGPAPGPAGEVELPGGEVTLGHDGPGFAFDNECGAHAVTVGPLRIDRVAVSWGRYRPFIDDGGYDTHAHWTDAGWAWRQRHGLAHPRYLHREDGVWRRAAFGAWQPMDDDAPVMHLSLHEAEAWCRWAGRRLPTEAEWVYAVDANAGLHWGEVWEWTASPFAPYPGFVPHPYRDYSMPWFDGRPVLRGASFATVPRMRHAGYRNYFEADRNDLFAGFRSCAA